MRRARTRAAAGSLDLDVEAASVVAEAADAGDLARLDPLAGHRLEHAGDEPALERAQRAAHRRHPRAGDTLEDVDPGARLGQRRHLDDADPERDAQLEEVVEALEAEL